MAVFWGHTRLLDEVPSAPVGRQGRISMISFFVLPAQSCCFRTVSSLSSAGLLREGSGISLRSPCALTLLLEVTFVVRAKSVPVPAVSSMRRTLSAGTAVVPLSGRRISCRKGQGVYRHWTGLYRICSNIGGRMLVRGRRSISPLRGVVGCDAFGRGMVIDYVIIHIKLKVRPNLSISAAVA